MATLNSLAGPRRLVSAFAPEPAPAKRFVSAIQPASAAFTSTQAKGDEIVSSPPLHQSALTWQVELPPLSTATPPLSTSPLGHSNQTALRGNRLAMAKRSGDPLAADQTDGQGLQALSRSAPHDQRLGSSLADRGVVEASQMSALMVRLLEQQLQELRQLVSHAQGSHDSRWY